MTLRLAVVGVGDVAQRDYLPELARLSEALPIAVVCGLGADRVRATADRYGVPRWTTSYEEAVAYGDVDAVVNLTPFAAHVPVTVAAVRAGKHVYSEKPLAPDSAGAAAIADAAAQAGVVVVTAPSVLVFPQLRRAAELLAAGALGYVHSARGHGLAGPPPWEGYASDPSFFFASDGGPLRDMAVYPLHALTGLLGPVREVAALSVRTRDTFVVADGLFAGLDVPVGSDDNWHLLLRLESGALASVEAGFCTDGALAPELELRGERGTLGVSLLDMAQPVRVVRGGIEEAFAADDSHGGAVRHTLGIVHLAECVESGRDPVLGVAHARHVIDVLEAAATSSRTGRVARVESSFPRVREVAA